MPGTIGNRNHLRHGLRSGSLPSGAAYIKRICADFQAALEDAVLSRKQEVTLCDAATIQSACRWERHAMLAGRWLRQAEATLTPDQRLAFSREVARASSERDKCIRLLDLDKSESHSILDALYGRPALRDGGANERTEAGETSQTCEEQNAPDATPEAQTGTD